MTCVFCSDAFAERDARVLFRDKFICPNCYMGLIPQMYQLAMPTPKIKREANKAVKEDSKKLHLDYIKLTDTEYNSLISRFGNEVTLAMMKRLNNYIGSTGRKYKSHYHTILTWQDKDGVVKPASGYDWPVWCAREKCGDFNNPDPDKERQKKHCQSSCGARPK